MISPELLRRYTFFSDLNDGQLKAMAMMGEEEDLDKGSVVLENGESADWLFLLVDGSIELFYTSQEPYHTQISKEFFIGEINPGEVFGVSAMIAPYSYNATAKAGQPSKIVRFEAAALRRLQETNPALATSLYKNIAQTVYQRLTSTRIQLAAAWAS